MEIQNTQSSYLEIICRKDHPIAENAVIGTAALAIVFFEFLNLGGVQIGSFAIYSPLALGSLICIISLAKVIKGKTKDNAHPAKKTSSEEIILPAQQRISEEIILPVQQRISEEIQLDPLSLNKIFKKGKTEPLTEEEKKEFTQFLKTFVDSFLKLSTTRSTGIATGYILQLMDKHQSITGSAAVTIIFLTDGTVGMPFEPLIEVRQAMQDYLQKSFLNVKFTFSHTRNRDSLDFLVNWTVGDEKSKTVTSEK